MDRSSFFSPTSAAVQTLRLPGRRPGPAEGAEGHMAMHNSTPTPLSSARRDTLHVNGYHGFSRRSTTPNDRPVPINIAYLISSIEDDLGAEENPRLSLFRGLYIGNEARISSLFEREMVASRTRKTTIISSRTIPSKMRRPQLQVLRRSRQEKLIRMTMTSPKMKMMKIPHDRRRRLRDGLD